MSDPLHDALREATLAVLLGSTTVPVNTGSGEFTGTVTIESAFAGRIQQRVYKGEFDDLIERALEHVDPKAIARAFEGVFAKAMLEGLSRDQTYGRTQGWLQAKAKEMAVEACKAALSEDEALIDTLRTRIGAEVDRNRVGITVSLSDPEKS